MKKQFHNTHRRPRLLAVITTAWFVAWLPALAVEDGLGTNIVKNLRVKDGGTLSLGGTAITNWSEVAGSTIDQTARDAAAAAQATATYGSNTANTANSAAAAAQAAADAADAKAVAAQADADTGIAAAASAQATATYGSNTANTANSAAAAAQAAADAADAKAVAAQADASTATNGLSLKYDKTGGTVSGNVTFGSNTVYAPQAQLSLANNASIIPDNAAVIKIAGASAAVTNVGIAAGAAGQILTLIGTDDTKSVKICATSANMVLTEGVDFTMGSNAVLQLIYTGAKWAEMHRATP